MASSGAPLEITSMLQSARLKRRPSPHDLNPSTTVSAKQPVNLDSNQDPDADSDLAEDETPIGILQPVPGRQTMPPLPDLRFEESYMKNIENAESWRSVLWITLRDHVIVCFAEGAVWALSLHGWKHWNKSAKFSGKGIGAKIRRWWWGVNNWTIPGEDKPKM